MSVNMSGSGVMGLGIGVGSYQPGVYVPLKALFLVLKYNPRHILFLWSNVFGILYVAMAIIGP